MKTKVAQAMVAIGIDWPHMDDGDKLNAVIGTGIGLIGVGLGVLGYKLTKRQGEIAEIQHRIMLGQLSLRPILTIRSGAAHAAANKFKRTAILSIDNSGKKPAGDVHFEIRVLEEAQKRLQWEFDKVETINAITHHEGQNITYSADVAKPIPAGRSVVIMNSSAALWTEDDKSVMWRVYSPDGQVSRQRRVRGGGHFMDTGERRRVDN